MGVFDLALSTLITPVVLFFVLGLVSALLRSDLSVPEAVAKGMSLYLLFAIGFKGGVSVADNGIDLKLAMTLLVGIILSALIPFVAYVVLRRLSGMGALDAAAVAGHYGSISIVTFVAATSVLESQGIEFGGYMVAVAAAMEAPAILSALWLVSRTKGTGSMDSELMREILLNGSIVLLVGSFLIGMITGQDGMSEIKALIEAPFKGVLCLFLLDMGIIAGRGLRKGREVLDMGAIVFGIVMPLIGALLGLTGAMIVGLPLGSAMLLMVLCASASYIAVPAAMRVALPEANPSIYLTLSLGVTFPFNLTLGIPLYLSLASLVIGG